MSLSLFSRTIGVVALLGVAGSAQATLFSFASDDESDFFTFRGTAATGSSFSMMQGRDPRNRVTLKIDDENGARPTVSLDVGFTANWTLTWIGSVGMGNAQTHAYALSGTFTFVDPNTGADLLTIAVTNQSPAGMTIGGTMSQWGSAGGMFGSDSSASVVYTATPALITLFNANTSGGATNADYELFTGASIGPNDDFGFSLTFVNAAGGPVPINQTTRLPSAAWNAEGSYSGSATFLIPSPGSLALMGAAGLVALRRRR